MNRTIYPGSDSIREEIETAFPRRAPNEHPSLDYLHLLHRHWQAGNLRPVDEKE